MRVEKEKHKVIIVCLDGYVVKGTVHIDPGLRLLDFCNDTKSPFVAVTNAEMQNFGHVHSFKLISEMNRKKSTVVLNKSAIRWIEES